MIVVDTNIIIYFYLEGEYTHPVQIQDFQNRVGPAEIS